MLRRLPLLPLLLLDIGDVERAGQPQQVEEEEQAMGERLWTDADYYYEDHVDNVWSIIISVLLNAR